MYRLLDNNATEYRGSKRNVSASIPWNNKMEFTEFIKQDIKYVDLYLPYFYRVLFNGSVFYIFNVIFMKSKKKVFYRNSYCGNQENFERALKV